MKYLPAIALLASVSAYCADPPPLVGWTFQPYPSKDAFECGLDFDTHHGGQSSAFIRSTQSFVPGYGFFCQYISTEKFKGKRIRLSAWMKARDVEKGGARLWLRVDGSAKGQAFDNMQRRPVVGSVEWKQYAIVFDVAPDATDICLGAMLNDQGEAWFDDFKLEEVGADVPLTVDLLPPPKYPSVPVNMDCELMPPQ